MGHIQTNNRCAQPAAKYAIGCAVACLLSPSSYTVESGPVRVVTEGIAMGQSIFGSDSDAYATDAWQQHPNCEICVGVDADAVKSLYLDTLALAANT